VCIINKPVVHHTYIVFFWSMFMSNTREDCLHSNIPCNSYSSTTKETKMDATILSALLFTMPARNLPILVIWVNAHLLLYSFHLNRGPDGVPYGGLDGVP
jgi:hypothetical protein